MRFFIHNFKYFKIPSVPFLLVALLLIPSFASSSMIPDRDSDLNVWFQERGLGTDFDSLAKMAQNIEGEDTEVHFNSILLLEQLYGQKASDVLLKIALKDSYFYTRQQAGLSLARLGDKRAIPSLKGVLKSDDIIQGKILVAYHLSLLGDLTGFKYVLEASKSKKENEQYFSVIYMVEFFGYRKKIKDEYGVDVFAEYFNFAKDPSRKTRQTFLEKWPRDGVSEEMTKKFIQTIKPLAESDPDSMVKGLAQLKMNRALKLLK